MEAIINYLETGNWTANATGCYPPYSYEWFLRKENNGPPVSVASSTWNRLILESVQAKSKTNKDSLKQPDEYTIFYLSTRVSDSDGFIYDTPEMRIVANGEVDLVPAFMPKNENNKSPDVTETEYVNLFPNPTSNNLTVKIVSENSNIEYVEVILLDRYMKTQKHKKAFGNELLLNVSNLTKGIYFLQVKYNDKIFVEKVMIE